MAAATGLCATAASFSSDRRRATNASPPPLRAIQCFATGVGSSPLASLIIGLSNALALVDRLTAAAAEPISKPRREILLSLIEILGSAEAWSAADAAETPALVKSRFC